MERAVFEGKSNNSYAAASIIHHEVKSKVLHKERGALLHCLTIQSVQHGMTGAISGSATAPDRRTLAILTIMAAERTLVDPAVLVTRKRHTIVLKLINCFGGSAAHVLDGVLVPKPVGTFYGVVHMPTPIIGAAIAKGRGDTAFRSNGVRPRRKHFADAGHMEACVNTTECRTQPRTPGPDNHDVECVVGKRISKAICSRHDRTL